MEFLEEISVFVREAVQPLEPTFFTEGVRAILPALSDLREQVRDRGWWSPHLSQALGGMGLGLSPFARVSETLGRSPLGHYVFNCQAPDVGNMEILITQGTEAQQQRWLGPLTRGEIRSCFSMTEPDRAGSNPTWMDTTAVIDGEDYLINGRKWFTSSADGAAFAVVMAITNPEAEKRHRRASMIIVPTDQPGFEIVRNISVMGNSGSGYFSHAEVRYTDCRVPQSYRLGEQGAGFAIAQERLGAGRIHHCMRWIGICERAFELMCARAASRMVSPDQALGGFQLVQDWIATSRAEIHAARLMVLDAADKIDRDGLFAAREEISIIKYFVSGVLQRVLDRALQTHGALGMTDDTPLAYWYSHERAACIYDGPDEVHKAFVARAILRRFGADLAR